MRYLSTPVLLALLIATLPSAGCKRRHHPNPAATVEDTESDLASVINLADARDASQILSGFHAVESAGWRWSMKQFAVTLAPPPGSARQGAVLTLEFVLPDVVAARMLGVSITPTVAGKPLAPCKVTKAGEQSCKFQVPPEALNSDGVIVQVQLDKALEPSPSDSRQLGLIVSRVGLSIK